MKDIGILILVAILVIPGGCVAAPSMEHLEDQAVLTGDWSHVERRERIIERRKTREPLSCGNGYVSVCKKRIGQLNCTCMSRTEMRDIFSTF